MRVDVDRKKGEKFQDTSGILSKCAGLKLNRSFHLVFAELLLYQLLSCFYLGWLFVLITKL